jgi:hypothetical protein
MAMRRTTIEVIAIYLVFLVLSSVAGFLAMDSVLAQAPPTYKPTEIQALRLQVKQRDALLAQRDYLDAQRRYQDAIALLAAEGDSVRRENKWPDSVKFNADTITFTIPEPAPVSTRPPAPTGVKP